MPNKVRSIRALAKACGMSHPALLAQMKNPGFPPADKKGLYSVAATKAFLESRRELDKANPGGSMKQSLERKAAAQAGREELKLQVERGLLIDKDTVEMQQRAFVQVVQSDLLNAHTTLAVLVSGKTGPDLENEIKAYMRRMIESWQKLAKKGGAE
jgi:hypothetical protein